MKCFVILACVLAVAAAQFEQVTDCSKDPNKCINNFAGGSLPEGFTVPAGVPSLPAGVTVPTVPSLPAGVTVPTVPSLPAGVTVPTVPSLPAGFTVPTSIPGFPSLPASTAAPSSEA